MGPRAWEQDELQGAQARFVDGADQEFCTLLSAMANRLDGHLVCIHHPPFASSGSVRRRVRWSSISWNQCLVLSCDRCCSFRIPGLRMDHQAGLRPCLSREQLRPGGLVGSGLVSGSSRDGTDGMCVIGPLRLRDEEVDLGLQT